MSIRKKLVAAVGTILVLIVVLLVGLTTWQFIQDNNQDAVEKVQLSSLGVDKVIETYQNELLIATRSIASTTGFAEAVNSRASRDAILNLVKTYAEEASIDVMVIVAADGTVLARSHDQKLGDNIGNRPAIIAAMTGKTTATMESTAIVKLSARVTAPIQNQSGSVVGTLICGKNMLEPILVDTIKDYYGSECTIFIGDTREMTTIMQGSQRAVGTKATPEIAEKVLKQGETYIGEATIFDKPFLTLYKPLRLEEGKPPVGMLFVGQSQEADMAKSNQMVMLNVLISVIFIVVGLLITAYIINKITKPIPLLADAVTKMADGDLSYSIDINSSDELGVLAKQFNNMRDVLRDLIGGVMESSNQLAASAEELTAHTETSSTSIEHISKMISTMAEGSANQLSSMDKTRDSLVEMNGNIEKTNEETGEIVRSTENAVSATQHGKEAVDQAVEQMNTIVANTEKVQSAVSHLSNSADEINQIIEVISSIAGQTNLLALNAAIEAARAGEHGRGFAVVAEEVRKLAEESGSAAVKIKELLQENQMNINLAVGAMQSSASEVNAGIEIVNAAGHSFEEIYAVIDNMTNKIHTVAGEIKQLNNTTGEVNKSVDGVHTISRESAEQAENVLAVTEEQTAIMSEMTVASRELAEMAINLKEKVDYFKV